MDRFTTLSSRLVVIIHPALDVFRGFFMIKLIGVKTLVPENIHSYSSCCRETCPPAEIVPRNGCPAAARSTLHKTLIYNRSSRSAHIHRPHGRSHARGVPRRDGTALAYAVAVRIVSTEIVRYPPIESTTCSATGRCSRSR